MSHRSSRSLIAVSTALAVSAFAAAPARAAGGDPFNPADYIKPLCAAHLKLAADNLTCEDESVKSITDPQTCKSSALDWNDKTTPRCSMPNPPPKATCRPMDGRKGSINGSGQCVYEPVVPVSAIGDYEGDCFAINTPIPTLGLERHTKWIVTDQKEAGADDRTLTLVRASDWARYPIGCRATDIAPKTGQTTLTQVEVNASDLMRAGANRYGWAYGFLTMPYKYYPKAKAFQGTAPIGGYVGWRLGQAGAGTTLAFASSLSSVKADTVDPKNVVDGKPQVTGSTQVAALSVAAGVIWDLSKSPKGKLFKSGLFMGVDHVNVSPTVSYPYNHKLWIAVQFGYEFTDN